MLAGGAAGAGGVVVLTGVVGVGAFFFFFFAGAGALVDVGAFDFAIDFALADGAAAFGVGGVTHAASAKQLANARVILIMVYSSSKSPSPENGERGAAIHYAKSKYNGANFPCCSTIHETPAFALEDFLTPRSAHKRRAGCAGCRGQNHRRSSRHRMRFP